MLSRETLSFLAVENVREKCMRRAQASCGTSPISSGLFQNVMLDCSWLSLFCFVLFWVFSGGGGICFCLLVGTFVFACLLAHSKRMSFSSGVVGPPPPPHEFTKLNLAQGANFCQANIWSATERPPVLCKI